jgi:hypothetical protein
VDLDETIWDWCAPIVGQPLWRGAHVEYIFVRRPLVRLLQGIGRGRLNAWTAGYGYRLDRVCEHEGGLAALLDLSPDRGDVSQTRENIVTRVDFADALERSPDMVQTEPRSAERWVSQKIPGMPTLAGKPLVDEARVLIDDRESNCRRYVAAGEGRSAIWLQGTPRVWKDNLPLRGLHRPQAVQWADGVADALEEIVGGLVGLFPVQPAASHVVGEPVRVELPHRQVWREWIEPSRRVGRILAGQASSG